MLRQLANDLLARGRHADVAIFHEFHRPPYGGGNQFLIALRGEFERRGLRVEANAISATTRACLINSFNFDERRLQRLRRPGCRIVHRVDGPVTVYRGQDDGTDRRIHAANQAFADATIFQSRYSLERHLAMGLTFRNPTVVLNTVDPRIFFPPPHHGPIANRRIRLVSTAWSDNPRKGAATYQWLDEHLDWDRFSYTFIGRSPVQFKQITMLPPVPSERLADVLRAQDIYITASLNDSCSNALLEAIACGLPALYADSGGNPEIVGEAGFGFASAEEVPALLDRLVAEYDQRRARAHVPTIGEVADRYLAVMGMV